MFMYDDDDDDGVLKNDDGWYFQVFPSAPREAKKVLNDEADSLALLW